MMKKTVMLLSSALALVALAASPAYAIGEAAEAEAARHHARAGGPINERDRDLLRRYGCFAPSSNQYCAALSGQSEGGRPSRRKR